MAEIMVKGYLCERCGHIWAPRNQDDKMPKVCPKCKNVYWNIPKKNKKK